MTENQIQETDGAYEIEVDERAQKFCKSGQFEAEIELYELAGAKEPYQILKLARSHFLAGHLEKAKKHYNEAIKDNENQIKEIKSEALAELGFIYTTEDKYEKAEKALKQSLEIKINADGHIFSGYLYHKRGLIEIEEEKKAANQEKSSLGQFINYLNSLNLKSKNANYLEELMKNPNDPMTLADFGFNCTNMKDYKKAKTFLQESIKADNNETAHTYMAHLLNEERKSKIEEQTKLASSILREEGEIIISNIINIEPDLENNIRLLDWYQKVTGNEFLISKIKPIQFKYCKEVLQIIMKTSIEDRLFHHYLTGVVAERISGSNIGLRREAVNRGIMNARQIRYISKVLNQ